MQENRKISADLLISLGNHLFRRAAHHHPVRFMVWVAQQHVADGAAYAKDFHDPTLPVSLSGALFEAIMTPGRIMGFASLGKGARLVIRA